MEFQNIVRSPRGTCRAGLLLLMLLGPVEALAQTDSVLIRAGVDCDGPSLPPCTTFIQDRIDDLAMQPTGGTIVLHGKFVLDGSLIVRSNVNLDGRQKAELRGANNSTFDHFFIHDNAAISSVTISGIHADGTRSPAAVQNFLEFRHTAATMILVDRLTIRDCVLTNFTGRPNITLNTNGSGSLEFREINIVNNKIQNITQGDAISLQSKDTIYGANNVGVTVKNNRISDLLPPDTSNFGFGVNITGANHILVHGNDIRRTCEEGIRVNFSKNVTISDNQISGRVAACTDGGGIKSNASTEVSIIGNTVRSRNTNLIEVLGGGRVSVVGNNLWDSTSDGIVVWNHSNMTAKAITIASNNVSTARYGILVNQRSWGGSGTGNHNVGQITITGNTADDVCTGILAIDDPSASGTLTWLTISNNVMIAGRSTCSPSGCGTNSHYGISACVTNKLIITDNALHNGLYHNTPTQLVEANNGLF